mgnify:CR=1 FL=1
MSVPHCLWEAVSIEEKKLFSVQLQWLLENIDGEDVKMYYVSNCYSAFCY